MDRQTEDVEDDRWIGGQTDGRREEREDKRGEYPNYYKQTATHVRVCSYSLKVKGNYLQYYKHVIR